MRIFLFFFLVLCFLGCKDSKLTSSGSQNSLSLATYYISSDTQVRVFQQASTDVGGLGVFVTDLSSVEGALQIPSTILKDDYGDRSNPASPQLFDLLVKAYNPSHVTGDFVFEAPLLGPDVKVTNVTTALYWFLKWGYNNSSLKISQNSFNSIATSVELICIDCRTRKNSEVLKLIQNQSDLMQKIQAILTKENPSLSLAYAWSSPALYYAWSSPVLSVNGYGAQASKQLQSVTVSVVGVRPEDSATRILPASWTLTRADGSTLALPGGVLNYTFTNDDQVSVDLKPTFDHSTLGSQMTIHYEVARANRAPVCAEPIQLAMKANRVNSIALTDFCYDPDNLASTPNLGVTYALLSGPSGLTISSSGILKWSPTNSLAGSTYAFDVLVTSSASVSHVAPGVIAVNAVALPVFTTNLPGITFTEGTPATLSVTTNDPAEDPLVLIVSSVTPVKTGNPVGAGILTSYTSTGTTDAPEFLWNFTPSYLQTIGGNGSFSLRFSLKYNTAVDPTLDGSLTLATFDTVFNVINADDPPLWAAEPQTYDLVEGQNFNIPVGYAADPMPNPTDLTYSFKSADSRCDWSSTASLSVDGSGHVFMSGYPDYSSREICAFQIIATDLNGLVSMSQTVTYTITNTNRPVTEVPGVTEVTGNENKVVILPISDMFSDEDVVADDPLEKFTWTCYVNTNGSSTYSDLCSTLNINFTLSATNLSGSWFAPYGSAGTYFINLEVTDIGGVTASHAFKLVIAESAAPMHLALEQDGIEVSTVTGAEGMISSFALRARAQSSAAVNQYSYNVSAPSCYVSSGSGSCRIAMLASPATMDGVGDQDFNFTLSPNYTDGDAVLPGMSRSYVVVFTVTKSDDPEVQTQLSVVMTVSNTNRAPTAIGLSSGSQGCTGSSANSLTTAFAICIDLSKNTKSGTSWQKSYSMTLTGMDPDLINDAYSFSLPTGAPGTISGNTWTIRLPSCLNAGNLTLTRSYNLQLSDGRGGTVTRVINMTFAKGTAASTCM